MKIAITQRVIDYRNGPYDALDHGFYNMFPDQEIIPIPNSLDHFRSKMITCSDLIVFSGGNSMVGGDWQFNEKRLRVEKHTFDLARLYKKPILGISRGSQFLTVSMGGSIGPVDGHKEDHDVLYRKVKINVCSRHEHRLTNTPLGANIICKDVEGNVESWKLDNILTVMWHPERMDDFWLPEEWKEIRPW